MSLITAPCAASPYIIDNVTIHAVTGTYDRLLRYWNEYAKARLPPWPATDGFTRLYLTTVQLMKLPNEIDLNLDPASPYIWDLYNEVVKHKIESFDRYTAYRAYRDVLNPWRLLELCLRDLSGLQRQTLEIDTMNDIGSRNLVTWLDSNNDIQRADQSLQWFIDYMQKQLHINPFCE